MTVEVDLSKARSHDPILDGQPVTALDELADELGELTAGEVIFPVAARPGYKVVFRKDLDGPQVASFRRAARDQTQPDGVNQFQWGCSVLAAYCIAIERQGQRIVDTTTGDPVTFRSRALWDILGVPAGAPSGAGMAVRKFYGTDAAVQNTTLALLAAAGFTDEVAPDPTPGSSAT